MMAKVLHAKNDALPPMYNYSYVFASEGYATVILSC